MNPDDLKKLKDKYNLTGARIGVLTGTSPRTVRQWLAPEEAATHQQMPRSAWRLLRILLGEATPEEIIRKAEGLVNPLE
jgi:DNA-binding transcriptional regulator YiaG